MNINELPIGAILPWHKDLSGVSNLSAEFAECNGQTINDLGSPLNGVTLPDLNGDKRFLRGGAVSGLEQADAFQGHVHNLDAAFTGGTGIYSALLSADNNGARQGDSNGYILEPVTDGASGTPRTADETRSINMTVIMVIKIKDSEADLALADHEHNADYSDVNHIHGGTFEGDADTLDGKHADQLVLQSPIGSISPWHKSFANTPVLPQEWVEMNGQTLADGESPYDGQVIPDWNGDGRFLRGGATSGVEQDDLLKDHKHDTELGGHVHLLSTRAAGTGQPNTTQPCATTYTPTGDNVTKTADLGNKDTGGPWGTDHNDELGGAETRPANASVVWIMRVK